MSLDCTTPRGLTYIAAQMACLKRLEQAWGTQIFPTIEDDTADVDAVAVKAGRVSAVMEIKSREMDLDQLRRFGSYLITFEKLLKLRRAAAALRVPGLVVVSLLKDDHVVFWKICDREGNLLATLQGKVTQTQATCNGGQTDRYNAYLSLDEMQVAL